MTSMAQESIRSRCRPLALLRQCRAERTLLQAPTVPPRLSTSSPFLQQCSSGPTLTLNTIGHRGSVDWSHPLLDTSLQAGAWISNLSQMGGRSTTTAFTFGQTRGYPGQVSACQHGFATNRTRHRLGTLAQFDWMPEPIVAMSSFPMVDCHLGSIWLRFDQNPRFFWPQIAPESFQWCPVMPEAPPATVP